MKRVRAFSVLVAAGLLAVAIAVAEPKSDRAPAAKAEPVVHTVSSADALRVEGEKRFQANCGRCHQFPHKFPPRMILTVERHMRVRALVTEDDMRVIIQYLTQ